MKKPGYVLTYIILMVAQILLKNYFNLSQFLTITILPVMILCLPVRRGTLFAMFLAFATGFAVDFISDGQLGLTILALVPVAFARRGVIRLIYGEELFSRSEDISPARQGISRLVLSTFILTALFLVMYITADGAGTRPFWFNLLKFALSTLLSTSVSIPIASLLCPDTLAKWK